MGDQRRQDRQAGISPPEQSEGSAADALENVFALRIENLWAVRDAYGEGAADCALAHVIAQLGTIIGFPVATIVRNSWIVADGQWIEVRLPPQTGRPNVHGEGASQSLALALCASAAARPFAYDGHSIHLVLSCHPIRARRVASEPGSGAAALSTDAAAPKDQDEPAVAPARPNVGWVGRYRSDMAEASGLLRAIEGDDFYLAWQPIRSSSDPYETLYYEGLLRTAQAADGDDAVPHDALCALERLGLVRLLDHQVVSRVIDQLEADPTVVVAANISALSAVFDQWWIAIESRLLKRRDVARRLVFEITETAELSPSEATIFTDRMRRLGCRIAVDDFGVGFASIRRLLALSPDIVKVDGSFVRRMDRSERDRRILASVIGLAHAISPLVVVEGVETESQREFLESLGADWIQGHCVGRPSVVPSWLFPNRHVEALNRFRDATVAHFVRGAA